MTLTLPKPRFSAVTSTVPNASFVAKAGETAWYPPVMIGADTLGHILADPKWIPQARALMDRLTPDPYTTYLKDFYAEGLKRFGANWRYADIVTVLLCLTETLKPRTYLEIGVRRGRSACAVASLASYCSMFLFDMWMANYAGMENPGPAFVQDELKRIGHRGPVAFTDGNSHETLPAFFARNPDAHIDLITVDGDHSELGAAQDMCDVLPRLAVGGAVVFDDIAHPTHPELNRVWRTLVEGDDRFSCFSYREAGYGVGFAVRKY
ncbi:MAG: class I SAM-dependent methyltransferase [Rhodospirillaceae bacterium]|nr:class I SAM-dependent methyltransferase [Rhodospirillaceae bacterium]